MNIEFLPVVSHHSKGLYENVHLLIDILNEYEKYSDIFEDDWAIPKDDYEAWLTEKLQCINALYPWFFAVTNEGQFVGWLWADQWQGSPAKAYSCNVGVVAKRKTKISENHQIFRLFLDKLFQETPVYIIHFETSATNKACIRGMKSLGIKHLETKRAWRVHQGQEVTGIIGSITRPEFEELKQNGAF